jgi:hypothetical protein
MPGSGFWGGIKDDSQCALDRNSPLPYHTEKMNHNLSAVGGLLGIAGGIFGILLGLSFLAFWIWMLVDCANNETSTGTKVAWILIILFASCLGAPVYFFVRKLPRKK